MQLKGLWMPVDLVQLRLLPGIAKLAVNRDRLGGSTEAWHLGDPRMGSLRMR